MSSEPSFSLTRCMTVSAFLNVTIMPPNAAGFGVNERAPLLLVIEIEAGPGTATDGAVGLPPGLVRTFLPLVPLTNSHA